MNTYTLEIVHDSDAEPPRENCEANVSIMSLFHDRYSFPNEGTYRTPDYESWADMATDIAKNGGVCITPVFMLDHSCVALSTSPFNDSWDSGQVGFAWTTLERLDYLGVRLEDAFKAIQGDVEAYSEWLNGECYGYVITDSEGMEVESCYGFIGSEYVQEYATTVLADLESKVA